MPIQIDNLITTKEKGLSYYSYEVEWKSQYHMLTEMFPMLFVIEVE
ncbi:hypothetical protein ACQKM9_03560 [Viridibacillus sp. NPDC093762]